MKMLGHPVLSSNHLNQSVREILRMGALKAYPSDVVADTADLLKKCWEITALKGIRIDVLSKQSNLPDSL